MPRQTIFFGTLLLAACSSAPEPNKTVKTPVVAVKTETPKATTDSTEKAAAKRKPNESPNGDIASIELPGAYVFIKPKTGEGRDLDANSLHPPPGNRSHFGIGAMTVVYLDDGTLLIGVADGTLIALDGQDKRKWSIGFRGSVTGITPTDDNRLVITTNRGVVAMVSTDGRVLWEKQVVAEALTAAVIGPKDHIYVAAPSGVLAFAPDGKLEFSHAATLGDYDCCTKDELKVDANGRITIRKLDILASDAHPPIVSREPIFVLNYEKVLSDDVRAMVASGPDDLWLLTSNGKNSEVVRYSSGTVKRIKLPTHAAKPVQMSEESKPEKPTLIYDDIVMGPNGNPWILTRGIEAPSEGSWRWWAMPAKAYILEIVGNNVRERNDLAEAFDEHWVSASSRHAIRAAHEGTSRVFCFGREDSSSACAIYDGNQAEVVTRKINTSFVGRVGDKQYIVPDHGSITIVDGKTLNELPKLQGNLYSISAIGGSGENDLWLTSSGNVAYHYNGVSYSEIGTPLSLEMGVLSRSATDAWSRNGQLHWDGHHWSVVAGAPEATAMVLRGQTDVWIGNSDGLFRGTAPGPTVVRLPAAKQMDNRPIAPTKELTLDQALTGYSVAQTKFELKNRTQVTSAKHVEVGRDGTLWVEAWDQLIEVDAQGQTAVIDKEEKRIEFERWFFPEERGRGITSHRSRDSDAHNTRDSLRQFEGGKLANADMKLAGKDIVAISGNQNGAAWILGSVEAGSPYGLTRSTVFEFGIHALVRPDARSKFQHVVGLPPLSYTNVAVTPEGGGFFIGALNAGPMGEGFLLHAQGPTGTRAITRFRVPAALLSVAAISNDEAWAVGAAGIVVHVKGELIERFAHPSGQWLRAVVATGPNDVWFGGDEGILVHYDGKKFQPVSHPLGSHAAFSGLGISRGTIWATSPSGILRITKDGAVTP